MFKNRYSRFLCNIDASFSQGLVVLSAKKRDNPFSRRVRRVNRTLLLRFILRIKGFNLRV
jgi:hypothetical protein